jgi:hypothetical protein
MTFKRRGAVEVAETKSTTSASKGGGKNKYHKLGAILEKKDGGVYLKFDTEFNLEGLTLNGAPVTSIQIEDPTAKFDRMVASGKISEAEADEKAAKVPSFVLFEVQVVTA